MPNFEEYQSDSHLNSKLMAFIELVPEERKPYYSEMC